MKTMKRLLMMLCAACLAVTQLHAVKGLYKKRGTLFVNYIDSDLPRPGATVAGLKTERTPEEGELLVSGESNKYTIGVLIEKCRLASTSVDPFEKKLIDEGKQKPYLDCNQRIAIFYKNKQATKLADYETSNSVRFGYGYPLVNTGSGCIYDDTGHSYTEKDIQKIQKVFGQSCFMVPKVYTKSFIIENVGIGNEEKGHRLWLADILSFEREYLAQKPIILRGDIVELILESEKDFYNRHYKKNKELYKKCAPIIAEKADYVAELIIENGKQALRIVHK